MNGWMDGWSLSGDSKVITHAFIYPAFRRNGGEKKTMPLRSLEVGVLDFTCFAIFYLFTITKQNFVVVVGNNNIVVVVVVIVWTGCLCACENIFPLCYRAAAISHQLLVCSSPKCFP